MISIYEFIYKKLSNSPAIASQVKQITPAVIKNMDGIPAITYNRIWEHRTGIARIANYQISIRAAKLEQAEEIANTVINLDVPEERRGTVFGVTTSLSLWGNVVGPVFTGVLTMQCGYGSVFWSTAFIFIFATILIKIQRERIVIDDRKRIW